MLNALTIDIEDYFQVHAFSDVIRYEDWNKFECRIERNTDRVLGILNESTQNSTLDTQNSKFDSDNLLTHSHINSTSSLQHRNTAALSDLLTHDLNNSLTQVHGTFFVLGWIAERYPDLVRRIQKEGHEIACHGYAHQLIYAQSIDEFRQDIRRAKGILEDITGSEVIGYRAPSYSITNKSKWAFQVLAEEGFKYDSSIFPIRHDFYGMPDAPRFPFLIVSNQNNSFEFSVLNFELKIAALTDGGTAAPNHSNNSLPHSLINNSLKRSKLNIPIPQSAIPGPCSVEQTSLGRIPHSIVEFPISTIRIFGVNFPISGGGYFRLLPYPLIKKGLRSINEKEGKSFIFYVHPWEFDPDQPHIENAANLSKFRHYLNLSKTEDRFRKLLKDFNFCSVKEILELNNLLLRGA